MRYKRAFTLVELMTTMAIISIAFILIWQIFFQGYKIFNNTNKRIGIQDEIRNAIMAIESEAAIANEILAEDNIYNIDGYTAKELLRLVQEDELVIYLEVKINDAKEQLWEIRTSDSNNDGEYLTYNSKNVLVTNIQIENNSLNAIKVSKREILINISFTNVSKDNLISSDEYSVTINTNKTEEIVIENDK